MRRPRTATAAARVVSAVLAAGLFGPAPSAGAADPEDRLREVEEGIDDLEHALEGTSAELAAAARSLAEVQGRLPQAQAELERAQQALAEAKARDAELAGRLAAATESEAKATQTLAAGEQEVAETRRTLGQIASQAYRTGTLNPGLALALSAQSPADFATRYVGIDTALRTQQGALARLAEQQALRANAEARLDAVRDEVDRLKQEAAAVVVAAREAEQDAAERTAEIEALVAQQREALAVIESRRDAEMARLDSLEAERDGLEAGLRRIAEEERRREQAAEVRRRAAAEQSRDAGRSSSELRASSGAALSRPVVAPISSPYGYRIHPIYGTRRLHAGTDFAASCGTPVRAAADGRVVRAGVAGGYGNQIVVQHGTIRGESLATSYNHLSGYAVRGGSVSRGEVIGYVGTTGASTGCHLHFEVYVNGSTTNPMGWL